MTERFATLEERVAATSSSARVSTGRGRVAGAHGRRCASGGRSRRSTSHVEPGPFDGDAGDRLLDGFVERYAPGPRARARCSRGGGSDVEHTASSAPGRSSRVTFPAHEDGDADASAALKGERRRTSSRVGFTATPVYDGDALQAGNVVAGPAIIAADGRQRRRPARLQAVVDRYLTLRLSVSSDAAVATSPRRPIGGV